jgi:hypothetical protein
MSVKEGFFYLLFHAIAIVVRAPHGVGLVGAGYA